MTQAEIGEVIEIGASITAESASPMRQLRGAEDEKLRVGLGVLHEE